MKAEKGQTVVLTESVYYDTPEGVIYAPSGSKVEVERVNYDDTGIFTVDKFECKETGSYSPVFVKHGKYEIISGDSLSVFIVKKPFDEVDYDMDMSVAVLARDEDHALEVAKGESYSFTYGNVTVDKVNMCASGIIHREVKYG